MYGDNLIFSGHSIYSSVQERHRFFFYYLLLYAQWQIFQNNRRERYEPLSKFEEGILNFDLYFDFYLEVSEYGYSGGDYQNV